MDYRDALFVLQCDRLRIRAFVSEEKLNYQTAQTFEFILMGRPRLYHLRDYDKM
jgi:hypothetical protein